MLGPVVTTLMSLVASPPAPVPTMDPFPVITLFCLTVSLSAKIGSSNSAIWLIEEISRSARKMEHVTGRVLCRLFHPLVTRTMWTQLLSLEVKPRGKWLTVESVGCWGYSWCVAPLSNNNCVGKVLECDSVRLWLCNCVCSMRCCDCDWGPTTTDCHGLHQPRYTGRGAGTTD